MYLRRAPGDVDRVDPEDSAPVLPSHSRIPSLQCRRVIPCSAWDFVYTRPQEQLGLQDYSEDRLTKVQMGPQNSQLKRLRKKRTRHKNGLVIWLRALHIPGPLALLFVVLSDLRLDRTLCFCHEPSCLIHAGLELVLSRI